MKRAAVLLVMMVMASCAAPHILEVISLAPSRRAATAGEGGMMTRHPLARAALGDPLRALKRQSPFRPNMETGWPLDTEPLRG